jgi:phosphoribosylglycinamide formyltransferase-1
MAKKLGVLASGRGSNLQSIMDNIKEGKLDAKIAVVICDKPEAKALDRARAAGIAAVLVDRKKFADKESFEDALLKELEKYGAEIIILAGFMRILSSKFVNAHKNAILNIHPSLLPSFKGAHAHRDVLAYGAKVSGCTIHFVDEGMDSGAIILQESVPVFDDDTEDTLAARVLEKEHKLYPLAIKLVIEDRLVIEGRTVKIKK